MLVGVSRGKHGKIRFHPTMTSDLRHRHPTPSYQITLRALIQNRPGMLGRIASAIGRAGGDIGAVDLVKAGPDRITRDISVNASNEEHAEEIAAVVRKIRGVSVESVSDRTFQLHQGGKIRVTSKIPLKTRDDLSMAYTPGVGRVSTAIYEDPEKAWSLTIKKNAVAIVTDGSAVLGLGNLGPLAALPVMEGKAMIFKEFADIDAFPLCLDTQNVDEIVATVKRIAPVFGAINLEDISSPRCFDVEERLAAELDIPVMHDDQHGTAIVVTAAMINALKLVKKDFSRLKVVMVGAGAAGGTVARMLVSFGVRNLIAFDLKGPIYRGRTENVNRITEWFAARTNPSNHRGSLTSALKGADVFLGLSAPGVVTARQLRGMAKNPIIFALANPTPEITPEEVSSFARITATGRSDYPNQINNALAYPGVFRGALDVRARVINHAMKLAAAKAIAGTVSRSELHDDYIIPSLFNSVVVPRVAAAVARAAVLTGVARLRRGSDS